MGVLKIKSRLHLSITACNFIKFIAIFLVLVGHYFKESTSFNFLHSIGFFGAALFAFLSGYGIMISYSTKGISDLRDWLLKKIVNIYVPVIFINVIQQLFFYQNSKNTFLNIFWINNDTVLWYIPYILLYNIFFGIMFWTLRDTTKSIIGMLVIESIWYVFAQHMGYGSQWYTSNGALFLGMYIANYEMSSRMESIILVPTGGLAVLNAYLSKRFASDLYLKDLSTLLSGLFFTWFIFLIFKLIEGKNGSMKNNAISYIGTYSLWIYIVHKKVLHYFNDLRPMYFIFFVLLSVMLSILIGKIYEIIKNGFICLYIKANRK